MENPKLEAALKRVNDAVMWYEWDAVLKRWEEHYSIELVEPKPDGNWTRLNFDDIVPPGVDPPDANDGEGWKR